MGALEFFMFHPFLSIFLMIAIPMAIIVFALVMKGRKDAAEEEKNGSRAALKVRAAKSSLGSQNQDHDKDRDLEQESESVDSQTYALRAGSNY